MKLESIKIKRIPDSDADTSYLEQEGFKERLQQYTDGQFGFIGITAEAEVSYDIGNGTRRLETLTSSGLWGIEDDSDAAYLRSIEKEELADLRAHCERFGVDVSNFDQLATQTAAA